MKLRSDAKRLGIFVFYDRDSIVDDYVIYMLDSFKKAVDDLIIVSNSKLEYSELGKLLKYTDDVIIRKNIGLDAGAFKYVYDLKSEDMKNYDELILMNDTFYGPFKPFKDIINEMALKDLDFWGLSANYNSVDGYGCLPDKMIHSHIQTFFIAYRKTVLNSEAFNKYWYNYNVKKMKSFFDVVTKHELAFTYYLEKNGFKWDVYSNISKYNNKDIKANFNSYSYVGFDMIKNCDFPIIKRKNFVFDKRESLYLTDGADARRSLDYIKEHNLYDVKLIWNNLIRLYKPIDLYQGLNLNYVISEEDKSDKTYGIVLFLEDFDLIDFSYELLKNNMDNKLFVVSNNPLIIEWLADKNIKCFDLNQVPFNEFDYVCIINDFYFLSQSIPSVYINNIYNIINNALYSKKYINGVLNTFKSNDYIGALFIPPKYFSEYFDRDSSKEHIGCVWIDSKLITEKSLVYLNNLNISHINDFLAENKKLFGQIISKNEVGNILSEQQTIIDNIICRLHYLNSDSVKSFPYALSFIDTLNINYSKKSLKGLIKKTLKRIKMFLKKLLNR